MTLLDRHYEYYIYPASKEYLADIVLLTMYNVDNMDLLSITPVLHRTLHIAEPCQIIEIVTQQDEVVRGNDSRCLKSFYANGHTKYVGTLQIVN